ncbi:hypothetical protein SDC9_95638 [bioreactor metagenome]|uniref:Antitoxin SocA-like Panacea domain-containing protein n=1 Tax=bioreactor metagenome TaxID=1076179 RepID=A0A645A9F1_9ZZZZ
MAELFELKTTEAAAYLLQKVAGRMSYLKLIKLLYLSDREAIKQNGLPITFDDYCVMKFGPVLSKTYDWIKGNINPEFGAFWNSIIQTSGNDVLSRKEVGVQHLSQSETDVLDSIFSQYGKFSPFDLVKITHGLPEYKEPPTNTSIPLSIREVASQVEPTEQDASRVLEDIALYKSLYS